MAFSVMSSVISPSQAQFRRFVAGCSMQLSLPRPPGLQHAGGFGASQVTGHTEVPAKGGGWELCALRTLMRAMAEKN